MTDIAQSILSALDGHRQIAPPSDDDPGFSLEAAYAVSDAVMAARIARGERPCGWKIGFTNRTIWDEYGVHAPIWGPMYRGTIRAFDPDHGAAVLDAGAFVEPRIEPEIVLRIARTPRAGMDNRELIACIDAVAHGFEVVQSIYPGWRFRAADTVAAFALHGALVHGPLVAIDPQAPEWIDRLGNFGITLFRDGEEVDRGIAQNVLGGPLSALRHMAAGLEGRPMARGIEPGDLVTTGTVTRAFPVAAGETWHTQIDGIPLPDMRMRFADRAQERLDTLVARAALARFRFENPSSCKNQQDYQEAMSVGVEAETAISRMLFRDSDRLAEARQEIERRAQMHAQAWNRRHDP
jgi:2-keto-4-pentenoate hydratase